MLYFGIAFGTCLILCSFFYALSLRPGLLKTFLRDKTTGVSKTGGLGLVFSFFCVVFWSGVSGPLLMAFGATFLLGFFDDIFCFSPAKKFAAQMAIAAFLVASGFCTQIIFFAPVVNVAVSVLWIVAVMNAFNFLDILDGLAAGISVITALTFVVIATCTRNTQVVLMALALLGGNLSFLAFNFPRARLYMGDMGSLFNGVVFAIMTMLVSYAVPGKEVAFLTPLLIMALPLYDLIFVMAMRFVARKPLAQKSRDHFVLRLVHRGLKVPHAVVLMYFFDLLFSGTAILFLMSSRSWVLAASLLGATAVAWFLCAYHLSRVEVGKAP